MTPAMRPRPRESLYPRWGFLDKFAVNEYMARSLLVTVVLLAAGQAGVATFLALRPETLTLVPDHTLPIKDVVIIDDYAIQPRPIIQNSRPKLRADTKPMSGGGITIVDDADASDNWDLSRSGGKGKELGIVATDSIDAPETLALLEARKPGFPTSANPN
jgi:hypothetical protein